jgi:hypothetical protein
MITVVARQPEPGTPEPGRRGRPQGSIAHPRSMMIEPCEPSESPLPGPEREEWGWGACEREREGRPESPETLREPERGLRGWVGGWVAGRGGGGGTSRLVRLCWPTACQ